MNFHHVEPVSTEIAEPIGPERPRFEEPEVGPDLLVGDVEHIVDLKVDELRILIEDLAGEVFCREPRVPIEDEAERPHRQ